MKKLYKLSVVVVVMTFVFVAAAPMMVLAEDGQNQQTSAEARRAALEEAKANASEKREALKERLSDAKLKACQNRQEAIKRIMSRLADRGQKQLNLFTSIAEKTEKFYTNKGKTLSNYDALVADVNDKKAAAQTEVDKIKSTSTTFDCSGDNPKGMVNSFQDNLKAEIQALKAYKTAVKNLIVGVKSVQGTTQSSTNGGQQ